MSRIQLHWFIFRNFKKDAVSQSIFPRLTVRKACQKPVWREKKFSILLLLCSRWLGGNFISVYFSMYRLGASVCVLKCERLEALNSVHIQCPYTRCKYITSFKTINFDWELLTRFFQSLGYSRGTLKSLIQKAFLHRFQNLSVWFDSGF